MLSSCVSTNKGFQSSPVISRNIELEPIKSDIVMDEKTKLTGNGQSSYFLFFRVSGDNTFADGINYSTDANGGFNPLKMIGASRMNRVRSTAAYRALPAGDFDVLVHPNYTMTTKNVLWIFRSYKCTVTGYGGKYTNYRTERQKTVIIDGGKEFVFPEK
jgi:hypothetical protein